MAYSGSNIKAVKDLVKSNRSSHRAALLLKRSVWSRLRWKLLSGYYREKFKKHFFIEGKQRPAMLKCETVNSCSYECLFCPYPGMQRDKTIMPVEVFEKVVKDYCEMGGGLLCLTPAAGDVFLDPLLLERITLLKKYEKITGVTFTTNAAMSHRLSDDELKWLLNNIGCVHLSVYGLNAEEHQLITKSSDFSQVMENLGRIIRLASYPGQIKLDFRLLEKRSYAEMGAWIKETFSTEIPYETTTVYGNWGDALDTKKELPLEGEWMPARMNKGQCIIPLVGGLVQASGNVSFCHCIDYDGFKEFNIGNIREQTLLEAYGSEKVSGLWNFKDDGEMPAYCRRCTFHKPFHELPAYLKTRLL